MKQHNYNITYCKPRKNRKNRTNKKTRKNKNPQKGGLKLDNEASFREMFPKDSLFMKAVDYFQTTDFKKDFKQLTTLINPDKIPPSPPIPEKVEIVVKPYKSEEMRDVAETKNIFEQLKFRSWDKKWLIIEHIQKVFTRDFFEYIDRHNNWLAGERQKQKKVKKKVDRKTIPADIKVTKKQREIFAKIVKHNLKRFFFTHNSLVNSMKQDQDWYLHYTLTQSWLDYFKYIKYQEDELTRAFMVYWEEYQKNLKTTKQKIDVALTLLGKMKEEGFLMSLRDSQNDDGDLNNPMNRLKRLFRLDKQ